MNNLETTPAGDRPVSYEDVNAAWGRKDFPVVTAAEAIRRGKQLYRIFAAKEDVPEKRRDRYIRYANRRRCWGSTEKTRNALNSGWRRMVHDVSHSIFSAANPHGKPHGPIHARIERDMIAYILKAGWIEASLLKPTLSADVRRIEELVTTRAAIRRWETKAKRAATALKKYRAKEKRLAALLREKGDT